MATSPLFITYPKMWHGQAATPNTNTDGTTGTYATIAVGGSAGSRIDWIRIQAASTSAVGNCRLFIMDNSAASATRMIEDVALTASVTAAAGTPFFKATLDYSLTPIILEANDALKATTHTGDDINIIAFGGDY